MAATLSVHQPGYGRGKIGTNPLEIAKTRKRANFEFLKKVGVEWWCFDDRGIVLDSSTLQESNENLHEIAAVAKELQDGTNIRPLWGTAQLFKHPHYMHGAETSPDIEVFAYVFAQVVDAIEVTKYPGEKNYVFWGGREGDYAPLNTDLKKN